MRGAQGELRDLARVRRSPQYLLSCQRPLTHYLLPWQVGQKSAMRPRPVWRGHLHSRGYHKAVRGAQGKRRDLARVRCRPECLRLCQRPLTRLLSHHPHPTPRSQSRRQRHRNRGRLRARCRPQGDEDHQPRVRRRTPSIRFRVSAIDTPSFSTWQLGKNPALRPGRGRLGQHLHRGGHHQAV